MSPGCDYSAPDSAWKIPDHGLVLIPPNINALVIEYNYKRADLVNTIPISTISGLVINSKFYNILLQFVLDEYQVFPAMVHYRKKDYPYHFIHFVGDGNRFVDFNKSSFELHGLETGTGVEPIHVDSYEAYVQKDNIAINSIPKTRIVARDLFFIEEPGIDFFRLYRLRFEYFVSERLKNELEAQQVTGIMFSEVE